MAAGNPAPQWQTATTDDWQGNAPTQPQQGQWRSSDVPNLSIAANQGPVNNAASSQWQPTNAGATQQAPLSLSQRMAEETQQHNRQQGSHIPAQQQQKPTVFKKPTPATNPSTETDATTETGSEVERLVNRVVFAVLDKLNDDTFTEKFTKAKELLHDNRQLAAQIQQLLGQQQQHQDEVNHLTQQLSTFKKLIGNIYLKID